MSTMMEHYVQQAAFTGCGICSGSFCAHGICRMCGTCELCDQAEKPAPRQDRRAEAANLHEKAEQRRQDIERAMAELYSRNCACGRHKREMQSFCKGCYTGLPKEIRAGLYLNISSGYLDFWHKAHELLRASGRIKDHA
jgi:hypothetical protein